MVLALNAHGQEKVVTNPVAGDPAAIQEGASLFRANCSPCHGLNAQGGGRGPDLTAGRWVHGSSDADIFRTITRGVPGTEMPANGFDDSETWAILAYLRSLAPAKERNSLRRSCQRGEDFLGNGGVLDLPHGARARWSAGSGSVARGRSALRTLLDRFHSRAQQRTHQWHAGSQQSLRPSPGVRHRDGCNGQTVKRWWASPRMKIPSPSNYWIPHQRLQFFLKKNLKEVTHERKSLMPVYSETMLKPAELQDLVAYLEALRDN